MRKNIVDDADEAAREIKRQFQHRVERAMKRQKMTPSELARRARIGRSGVHRMLRSDDPGLTLTTMVKAAVALGIRLDIRTTAV